MFYGELESSIASAYQKKNKKNKKRGFFSFHIKNNPILKNVRGHLNAIAWENTLKMLQNELFWRCQLLEKNKKV